MAVLINIPFERFFVRETPVHPEIALMSLDVFLLLTLCKVGETILTGAESLLHDAYSCADFDAVNEIKDDMVVIERNLKVYQQAYSLAMN